MIKPNTILHGDCLELMKDIEDKSIHMVLCDLPYSLTACAWDKLIPFELLWAQYKRIIKDNGAIVLTASQPFTTDLINSNRKMFKYELIWNKVQGKAPGVAKFRPMPSHENILIFGKANNTYNPQMTSGKPYKDIRNASHNKSDHFGLKNNFSIVNEGFRYPTSVIEEMSYNVSGQHPTQKPVALFEYLIRTYTNEGDLVLDNAAGSFTTAVSCINTNRNYICMEKEEKYFNIGKERFKNHVSQLKIAI